MLGSGQMRFRQAFEFAGDRNRLNWFIGHMNKGLRDIRQVIRDIDCVIEVHDARIPFSGRNHLLQSLRCPRILVLNKADVADETLQARVAAKIMAEPNAPAACMFTDAKISHNKAMRQVMDEVLAAAAAAEHEGREKRKDSTRFMVVGIPNVGKSSFINAVRRLLLNKKNCVKTGREPGITRTVGADILIMENPKTYLVDTPGIMRPHIPDLHSAMRLAAIGTMRDTIVGEELIADYILFLLNQRQNFTYVEQFNLSEPTDDIQDLLSSVARYIGAIRQGNHLDITRAANFFINWFRSGKAGRMTLDDGVLNK